MNSEVLVIGGGIIGLSIARALRSRGVKDITLIERGICGMAATNAAAGMLAPRSEATKDDVFFKFCCGSRDAYPAFAAELLDETGIDIELDRTGTIHPAFSEGDSEHIRQYVDWQLKAGMTPRLLSAAETLKAEPNLAPTVRESLYYPDDWQVENRKLAAALRKFAELSTIRIIENSKVSELIVEGQKVSGARTADGVFNAECTILATGAWTSNIRFGSGDHPLAVEPVRGQMICFQPKARIFRHVIFSERGYFVPRSDGRLLVGATVERVGFDDSTTKAATIALRRTALATAPALADAEIIESWAGLRPAASDHRPILGEIPGYSGVLAATAHYRNGILLAPLTAAIIAEKIIDGTDSRYLNDFAAKRFLRSNV